MIYINHRINTISLLSNVPEENGLELDVRYHKNELILHHDPFYHHESPEPEKFENVLKAWKHKGPMILNVKTEGIEKECIRLMNKYTVKSWFFLDLSMPYFALYAEDAINNNIEGFTPENLSVRFSEREALEYALGFAQKAKWVWVDCFSKLPLDDDSYSKLKEAGFKICVVSPELQKHSAAKINEFKEQLVNKEIDAVCTKRTDIWKQNLSEEMTSQLKERFPIV